jgi:hypothetical protein
LISNQLIFLNKVAIILTKHFTPFSYLFFICYFMFLISLFTFSDFFVFWTVIEFSSLVFIGLSFRIFRSGYSQLISYFLIQALASLILITSYIYSSSFFFTLALIIKLSIFPFIFWFINIIVRFSNFILWLTIRLHKIPAVLIVYNFTIFLNLNLLFISLILSVFFSGVLIISTLNLRFLLILASVGNNAWFILSQYLRIIFLLLFITFYSLLLFITFYSLSSYSKEISSNVQSKNIISLLILRMSGLPPFPLFYFKLYIIYSLIMLSFNLTYFSLFLLLSSFILIGYVHYLFKYYTRYFNNISNIVLINK